MFCLLWFVGELLVVDEKESKGRERKTDGKSLCPDTRIARKDSCCRAVEGITRRQALTVDELESQWK